MGPCAGPVRFDGLSAEWLKDCVPASRPPVGLKGMRDESLLPRGPVSASNLVRRGLRPCRISGLARICGRTPGVLCHQRAACGCGAGGYQTPACRGEVARSSTALSPGAGVRAGPGFSLVFGFGFACSPWSAACGGRAAVGACGASQGLREGLPGSGALRRATGRGLRSSFPAQGVSSRIPLNIRAGLQPDRKEARSNGQLRKPGRGSPGMAEAGKSHCTSIARSNAHAAAGQGCPAAVKLCERYRDRGQGSILSGAQRGLRGGTQSEGTMPRQQVTTLRGTKGLTPGNGIWRNLAICPRKFGPGTGFSARWRAGRGCAGRGGTRFRANSAIARGRRRPRRGGLRR